MVQSLHAGDNMEFFIEGSRSRSGKPGMPKAGLLSVLVDSLIRWFWPKCCVFFNLASFNL